MTAPAPPLLLLPLAAALAAAGQGDLLLEALGSELAQEDSSFAVQALQIRASELRARPRLVQERVGEPAGTTEPGEIAAPEESAGNCSQLRLQLLWGDLVGFFDLPGNSTLGAQVARPCAFDGESFAHGNVTFECGSERWRYRSNDCAACPAAEVPVAVGNATAAPQLPLALRRGDTVKAPCAALAGGASFGHGDLSFRCGENGSWALAGESCKACQASSFTLRYAGDPGRFKLPAAREEGSEVSRPCAFTNRSFALGSVRFQCKAGRWGYAANDCAACGAATLNGSFALPRAVNEGETRGLPCRAPHRHGEVRFRCREGNWSYLDESCAACSAVPQFRLSYGEEEAVYSLPKAPEDGAEVEKGCSFVKSSEGSVRFECREGRWTLRQVNCTAPR